MRALFKAMRNVCQKYPYIFKRKVRETKNKAEEEDTIGSIECQDKNCGVKRSQTEEGMDRVIPSFWRTNTQSSTSKSMKTGPQHGSKKNSDSKFKL